MKAFGILFSGLYSTFFAIFGRFFVAEKVIRLTHIATVLSLIALLSASLFSCVHGACAAGLTGFSIAHTNFAVGLGMVFNTATFAALSCYMTVWLGCQMLIVKKRMLALLIG